jgi:methanol metabolism-related c-type cytochrome
MMKKCLTASAFKMPAAVVLAMAVFSTSVLLAAGPSVREEEGKHFNKDGEPTYNVQEDGTVDWYTYSGFRRYHSECHVCHGPDGMGSTYAPAITDSLKSMSYADYLDVVVNGREIARADKTSVMPAFGDNQNVMCFVDDLFVYLKARANDAIPRGRPQKRAEKPEDAIQYEKSCFGRD